MAAWERPGPQRGFPLRYMRQRRSGRKSGRGESGVEEEGPE
jgi:hypothetical protein